MLSAKNLNKDYNHKPILTDVSFSIQDLEKVGLIGVNGTGKSTLLKVIAGLEDASGSLIFDGKPKIAYLSQDPIFHKKTIWEEMVYQNKKNEHPAQDYQIKTYLTKLGFSNFDLPIDTLSGGQKKRLALAIVLITESDFLLLDEPTNHLDNEMIEWLETILSRMKATVLMVTHDRYFLDTFCTRILELDHGNLYMHDGNFETYLANKAERELTEKNNRQKLENIYRKELAWIRAGVQARGTKSKSRIDNFEKLRAARTSNQKQNLSLDLGFTRLGKKTIGWENLGFSYPDGKEIFHDFSYVLTPTDRVGIAGINGAGKSTFLNILAHNLKATQGKIWWGDTVKIGFFEQNIKDMDQSMRVMDYLEDQAKAVKVDGQMVSASSLLERFLFPKETHYLPIERLSGGEKRRLYLLSILIKMPNVLLLDEPTNDLDIMTLEILEDYLDDFKGIVIAISHDRYFLDRVCERMFALQDGTWIQYTGGYSEYLKESKNNKQKKEKKAVIERPKRKNFPYMKKKELESLGNEIPQLEKDLEELNQKIGGLSDFAELESLCQKRDVLEAELESKTERWMELEEERENLENGS